MTRSQESRLRSFLTLAVLTLSLVGCSTIQVTGARFELERSELLGGGDAITHFAALAIIPVSNTRIEAGLGYKLEAPGFRGPALTFSGRIRWGETGGGAVELGHISHPLAGWPVGPTAEEDGLSHISAFFRSGDPLLQFDLGAGYKFASPGISGGDLLITSRIATEITRGDLSPWRSIKEGR